MYRIINTVWIGRELGPLHGACLRSMQRQGHEVVLHAYGRPIDLPHGVKLFDASRLMQETEIIRHRQSRSLTLAADIYRYRLLREDIGPYVDCDMFLVKPLPARPYIYGWQGHNDVNNAVLAAPHDSELVTRLCQITSDPYFIPWWRSKGRRLLWRSRRCIGMPKHVSSHAWGMFGPTLLSQLVKQLDLAGHAAASDIYYPLHYQQRDLLYSKGLRISDLMTSRSIAIHLYNSALDLSRAVPGSPLHAVLTS